jgi:hypothetical protein
MGLSTISLGKSVSQASKPKERKNLYGQKGAVFRQSCFCMNNKQRTEKKSIGAGATMEGKLWSIFGDKD